VGTASPYDLVRDDMRKVERRMRALPFPAVESLPATLKDLLGSGGKRIRPTLTLLFGRMFAVPQERLFSLAAAVEVVHTATLVHDDLIDNAQYRRGKPTVNARWQPGTTVLLGDLLFAWAAQLAAATGSAPVMQRFAAALTTVVSGEIVQTVGRSGRPGMKEYLHRIRGKTAALFTAACESPGLLAGLPAEARLAASYGENLGIAFQMTDDILDFTGKDKETGKPTGSDLRQGLITLPAICYRREHPRDADLNALMGGRVGKADVGRLLQAVRESSAIARAQSIAGEYAGKAAAVLARLPAGPHRDALNDLTRIAVDRNR
jgi:geranylgeranyl pyrophosphate synthase